MSNKASVIDLFAGPGGLGEGFSAYKPKRGARPFHIELSVEKEASAHKTLELRAFYRQFKRGAPSAYYDYLRDQISRDELFSRYPEQHQSAVEETLGGPRTLGDDADDRLVYKRLKELKNHQERPFVVIGGPPCQAYSLVGRARNKGISGYRAEDDHRHFLYLEYLRVLWTMEPEVFVMENVKGILSSKVGDQLVFPQLLGDLRDPGKALSKKGGKGYRIFSLIDSAANEGLLGRTGADYVIRCEQFGVPQSRHRVILLGIRNDIDVNPDTLNAQPPVSTRGVIADLAPLRSGLSRGKDSPDAWKDAITDVGKLVRGELSRLRLDTSRLSENLEKSLRLRSRGNRFVPRKRKFRGDETLADWLLDDRLRGFVNHETRTHIKADLARYLFCSSYAAATGGMSPRSRHFPTALAPNHVNWKSGKFADRFKVQSADSPSSTITSHISKDGHYYIHYDPAQCRSLTVREAARLQTFPDNYYFEGNRTQQYIQVGNAVPPYLAVQIAKIVHDIIVAI